jgi:hypothetical protein
MPERILNMHLKSKSPALTRLTVLPPALGDKRSNEQI